jgi:outer membrane protein TolC
MPRTLSYILLGFILLGTASCRYHTLQAVSRLPDQPAVLQTIALSRPIKTVSKGANPISGTQNLTFDDCRGLVLNRNFDLHVARFEEMTKDAIALSHGKKMLPHLVLASELSQRDNYGYSFSDVLGQEGVNPNPGAGNTGVTNYSVGHERTTWRYSFELNWSPTDTALAYFLTGSGVNDSVRAHCQRVRVAQKLIGAADSAFYRLLGLQEQLPLGRNLVKLRTQVVDQTDRLHKKQLKSIEDLHRSKQNSIKAGKILMAIEEELEKQRNILRSVLFIAPESCAGGPYALGRLSPPGFCESLPAIEAKALQNRPEVAEAGLNIGSSRYDVKRTMIKYFPKITGFWRYTRDKDRFLMNKDWKEIGFRTYFDLEEWLVNRDESKAAESAALKAEFGAGAAATAIATQVRTAALVYFRSVKEFRYAETGLDSVRKVLGSAKAKASNNDLTKLSLLEIQADALESEIERLRALAESNAAFSELSSAMGINYNEPMPQKE